MLPFFVRRSVVFARYSDFRYLVVWVCIPGLVNGTASSPLGRKRLRLGHGEDLSNQLLPKKIEAWAPGQ